MRVKDVKRVLLQLLRHDDAPAVMLWGPPGVGKSQVVRQCADELGWGMVDLRLSQMSPVDLRGVPALDRDMRRSAWYPPIEFPDVQRDGEQGILFLDEIANAPRDVQTAALQLVLDRRLGDYALPEGWRVVAAGNRVTDRAGSYQLTSSLANRFIHLPVCSSMPGLELSREPVDVSSDDWREWAYDAGVREEVIAFITRMPDKLWAATGRMAYATPRSWQFVSNVLNAFGNVESAMPAIAGCVGEGPAAEFAAFCRVRNEMPDPDAILAGADVPAPVRPDVSYALSTALVVRLRGMVDSKARDAKTKLEQSIDNLWRWVDRMPVEFQVLIATDCGNNNVKLNTAMVSSPHFAKWVDRNKAVFSVSAT